MRSGKAVVKCLGGGVIRGGEGVTSLGASVMRDEGSFTCGGESFLHDKVSVTGRKVSVTRDRSSVRIGEENERKDEVTQIKTRRWNHGKISEERT